VCPVVLTCIFIHDDSTTGRGGPNSDVLTREITTSSTSTLKVSRSQLTGPVAELDDRCTKGGERSRIMSIFCRVILSAEARTVDTKSPIVL